LPLLVIENLRARGIPVDLLEEFDPRLSGYSATALVSIHADSCLYYNEFATGYKIAGSPIPIRRPGKCVERVYRDVTGLPYHANTITPHMTDYHAFRTIAPGTPAIIIETGFMNLDRDILTVQADIPARGITNGILCYLEQR
jgi:N-acetylmuramoyl-L-alanine amidase